MLRAGFAEIDITPPLGTEIVGWIKRIESKRILDPLFARAAVIESGAKRIALLQLDLCFVPGPLVQRIRTRCEQQCGISADAILIAATHNHAGPVTETMGECTADPAYLETLVERAARACAQASAATVPAEIGQASGFCFDVAHNRRVVQRDGTVRTHGTFKDPQALCFEGPIDPELAVLAARDRNGTPLGVVVNFACHPTHHGSDASLSAGFPGVLAAELKAAGWPVALFLNGAAGNLHTADPSRGGANLSQEEAGARLAQATLDVLQGVAYSNAAALESRRTELDLPYRTATEEERRGTVRGAQRFIDPGLYDKQMDALAAFTTAERAERIELQALCIGERAYVSVPGEFFVELGLQLKESCHPLHALVVGYANGSAGYIPHRAAFERGGYETTFGWYSKVAPGAGERIVSAATRLVTGGH